MFPPARCDLQISKTLFGFDMKLQCEIIYYSFNIHSIKVLKTGFVKFETNNSIAIEKWLVFSLISLCRQNLYNFTIVSVQTKPKGSEAVSELCLYEMFLYF